MASTENTSVNAPNNTNSGAPNAAGAAANYPMASLHVGDLSPEVTEAVLYEKFSTIGPVLSIRICRDIVTRQSLGYGYVNYQDPEDAERALDTFNFEKIGSQNVRIMWSQRDPSLRRSGVGNVFIKNLDKSVDNKTLYDTFVTFGTILSCKISLDENGVSKGYGFVHFSTQQSANNAIENLNNKIILDKKIYVGPFMDRVERGNRGLGSNRFTNLFVKNLPEDIDSTEKLSELFVPHGTITSAVVVFEDGKSKGFGFVCFQSPDSAEAAVKAINGTELNGKVLYVGRAQKKAEREAELRRRSEAMRIERNNRSLGANLFVKNLDDTINDEALHSSFAPYGTITSSKVMCDARGRSKGFGFVSFSTPEEATRAVTEMNGKIIVSKPLFVSLAQRKEDRIAQRNAMARIGTVPPQSIGAWPNLYLNTPQQQGYILPIGGMPMQPFSQEHMDFGHFRGQRGQFNMGRLPGNQYNLARGPRIPQGNRSVGSLIHPRQMPQWHTRGQGPNLNRHSRGQSIRGDTRPPFSRPLMEYPVPVANPVVGDSLQEIGERLYSLISPQEPNYAGKITGMLLEMERPDILEVINSPDLLKSKVDEALKVLMDHATTPAAPL